MIPKPFLRRTLLDHFVVGDVDPKAVAEGEQFTTVGGSTVTFTSGEGGRGRMKIRWARLRDACPVAVTHGWKSVTNVNSL